MPAEPLTPSDPHAGQPVLAAGPRPEDAAATLVLVHGRGGSADDILTLHRALDLDGLAALAPQAADHTWYPNRFIAPIESNQPWLDSALARLTTLVDDLAVRGVPAERVALLGFSQGACLVCDFVARNPKRYGSAMALCGGLIGPPGTTWDFAGSLHQTPVFLGASDPDPHIPFARVAETQRELERLGAAVELRRYPDMPHAINADELDVCRAMLAKLIG